MRSLQWDIFCKVIDNFGDIGVCWRLACDLAARGQQVRLWADDARALSWMAPSGAAGVHVLPWEKVWAPAHAGALANTPCDVLLETFGCHPAPEFIAGCARNHAAGGIKPVWINIEYLSAQAYAERNHLLPSPVGDGPAAGWHKHFFYPGFTVASGGLLRQPELALRRAAFDREAWLRSRGVEWQPGQLLVSLFCYEPPALAAWLRRLALSGLDEKPVALLVTAGRAAHAVQSALSLLQDENFNKKGLQPATDGRSMLSISYLPLLSQTDFDHLLWACDLNFVRGEDSVVRALWAGKPLVWQIYPQDDGAHHAKLEAFLGLLAAPPSLRAFHQRWNAGADADAEAEPGAPAVDLPDWSRAVEAARAGLEAQDDLVTRLLRFALKSR